MSSENSRHWVMPRRLFRPDFIENRFVGPDVLSEDLPVFVFIVVWSLADLMTFLIYFFVTMRICLSLSCQIPWYFSVALACCMPLLGSEHLPQGQDLLLGLPQLRLPLLPLALLLLCAQTLEVDQNVSELLDWNGNYLEVCPDHTICWWGDVIGGALE